MASSSISISLCSQPAAGPRVGDGRWRGEWRGALASGGRQPAAWGPPLAHLGTQVRLLLLVRHGAQLQVSKGGLGLSTAWREGVLRALSGSQ